MNPQNDSGNFIAQRLATSAAASEPSSVVEDPLNTEAVTMAANMATNMAAPMMSTTSTATASSVVGRPLSPGSSWARWMAATTRPTPISGFTMNLASTVVTPALTSRPRPAIVAQQPTYAEVARELEELRRQLDARREVNVPAPTAATDPDVFRRDSRRRDETVDRSTAPIPAVPEPVNEGPLYRSRELCAAAPINPLVTGDLCPVPSRVPSDPSISTGLASNTSLSASEPNRAGPSRD